MSLRVDIGRGASYFTGSEMQVRFNTNQLIHTDYKLVHFFSEFCSNSITRGFQQWIVHYILFQRGVMKGLIVYDSVHGNTEKIAKSIGDAITGNVKVLRTGEVNPPELESIDETPCQLTRAPLLGEHNEEVYCGRLGFDREDLVRLRQLALI